MKIRYELMFFLITWGTLTHSPRCEPPVAHGKKIEYLHSISIKWASSLSR